MTDEDNWSCRSIVELFVWQCNVSHWNYAKSIFYKAEWTLSDIPVDYFQSFWPGCFKSITGARRCIWVYGSSLRTASISASERWSQLTSLSIWSSSISVSAWWRILSEVVVFPPQEFVFARYPQLNTRAFWIWVGRRSRSQQIWLFSCVHVLMASPWSPCTAITLSELIKRELLNTEKVTYSISIDPSLGRKSSSIPVCWEPMFNKSKPTATRASAGRKVWRGAVSLASTVARRVSPHLNTSATCSAPMYLLKTTIYK